jgi:hypothetical protein
MGENMKNIQQATHSHKRAGAVVVLQTTLELARIRVLTSGDKFWVKLADLTELIGGVVESKPSKKGSKAHRPNGSQPGLHRVVHAL